MDNKKEVLIISNYSFLTTAIAELFLTHSFRVVVFSENIEPWSLKATNLKNSPNFQACLIDELEKYSPLNFLYLDSLIFQKERGVLLTKLLELLEKNEVAKNARGYLVFDIKGSLAKSHPLLKKRPANLKLVYVDDVFGPEIVDKGISIPTDLLIDAVKRRKIVLPKNDPLFRPAYAGTVAKEIVRLYSDGFPDSQRVLLAKEMAVREFAFEIAKELPDCGLTIGNYRLTTSLYPKEFFLLEEAALAQKIKFSLAWYQANPGQSAPAITKVRKAKAWKKEIRGLGQGLRRLAGTLSGGVSWLRKKLRPLKNSLLLKTLALSLVIVAAPLILLLFSVFLVLLAQEGTVRGSQSLANRSLRSGLAVANLSEGLFLAGSKAPFFPREYLYLKNIAQDIKSVANIGSTATDISLKTVNLSKKILGDRHYSLSDYSKALAIDLDKLYRQISFFEGDIKSQPLWHFKETAGLLNRFELGEKRGKLVLVKKLTESLPGLLAEEGEKNYLLLFQNNMELRPTGGFIGSFAIVKFKQGRLADLNVMDVYSADGQLKGHVEPPSPLKNYLNQANWYLRDSNWDPDFMISAQRAEWFVNKEIDVEVDGVVAVDLHFIADVMAATGPVKIKDYDREVNKDNLYEIVQYEAEKDFFPGSQRKASFLTSLSRELILSFSQGQKKNILGLASALYSNLEEGHIQIFVHDNQAQAALDDLGWSGRLTQLQCALANCYADWAGVVEANLGVNKANYFVERSLNLASYVDGRILKRRLELNLKSTANPALAQRGSYAAYVRLIVPANAEFEEVKIVNRGKTESLRPEVEYIKDRTEAGVYIEILPSTSASLAFAWKNWINLDFSQKGQYLFYLRKQPGTDSDPVRLDINLPKGLTLETAPNPWLISTGMISYNLALSKNIKIETSW